MVDTIAFAKYVVPAPKTLIEVSRAVPTWNGTTLRFAHLAGGEAVPIAALEGKPWRQMVTLLLFTDVCDDIHFMVCVIYGPARLVYWFDPSATHGKDAARDEFFKQFKLQLLFDKAQNNCAVEESPNDWTLLSGHDLDFPRHADLHNPPDRVPCALLVCAFSILVLQEITPTWSALGLAAGTLLYSDLEALGRSLISMVLAGMCVHSSHPQTPRTEERLRLACDRILCQRPMRAPAADRE